MDGSSHEDILLRLINEQIELEKQEIASVLPKGENRFLPFGKIGFDEKVKPITYTTTETIYRDYDNDNENGVFSTVAEKTPSPNYKINAIITNVIGYYFSVYKEKLGKEHPKLKPKQYQRIVKTLSEFHEENYLEEEHWYAMIGRHFERSMETDYNINHFATKGVLTNIMYESAY